MNNGNPNTPQIRYDVKAFDFIHKSTGIEKAMLMANNLTWFSDEEILKILIACADYTIITNKGMRQYYTDFITPNTDSFANSQMFVLNAYSGIFKQSVDVTTPGSIIYDICQKYVFVTSTRTEESTATTCGIFKQTLLSYAMCSTFIAIERTSVEDQSDENLDILVKKIADAVNVGISCHLTEVISYTTLDVTVGLIENSSRTHKLSKLNDPKFEEISNGLISFGINPDKNLQTILKATEFFALDIDTFLTKLIASFLIRYLDVCYKFGFIKETSLIGDSIQPVLDTLVKVCNYYAYDISKFNLGIFRSMNNVIDFTNFADGRYTNEKYNHLHMGCYYTKPSGEDIVLHINDILYKPA